MSWSRTDSLCALTGRTIEKHASTGSVFSGSERTFGSDRTASFEKNGLTFPSRWRIKNHSTARVVGSGDTARSGPISRARRGPSSFAATDRTRSNRSVHPVAIGAPSPVAFEGERLDGILGRRTPQRVRVLEACSTICSAASKSLHETQKSCRRQSCGATRVFYSAYINSARTDSRQRRRTRSAMGGTGRIETLHVTRVSKSRLRNSGPSGAVTAIARERPAGWGTCFGEPDRAQPGAAATCTAERNVPSLGSFFWKKKIPGFARSLRSLAPRARDNHGSALLTPGRAVIENSRTRIWPGISPTRSSRTRIWAVPCERLNLKTLGGCCRSKFCGVNTFQTVSVIRSNSTRRR